MKNAPIQNSDESVRDKRDYTPGVFVERHNTVSADVLAALLQGEQMTGMDAVFSHNTTRLSAVVHRLEKKYGWQIDRCKVQIKTKDGRQARITGYWLSALLPGGAVIAGAAARIDKVKIARTKRNDTMRGKA